MAAAFAMLLLAAASCAQPLPSGQRQAFDRQGALNAGTSGVIHAVVTTEPSDGSEPIIQDVFIDADRNRSFSREFGQHGELERLVIIEGRTYREYLASPDWLIERQYQSGSVGAFNELTDAVFGYKHAIEASELSSVNNIMIDGTPAVEISYTRTSQEFGVAEFIVYLDAETLLPMSGFVRTKGLSAHDLAQIDYDVDVVTTMPDLPEVPSTKATGSESYTELASQDVLEFDKFPVHVPTSQLLDGYTPEIVRREVSTSEEGNNAVNVYYWPSDKTQREMSIPGIQVTNMSADSVDTTYLERSGQEISLPDGPRAVEIREGDSLLTLTWSTGSTRITVFGNLKAFSESEIRRIASSVS